MGAVVGSIAFVITVALLAILCKKRYLSGARRRAAQDPFIDLDLDAEMAAVNQPLIIGDTPGPGGGVYSDPYTDDSRQRTRSGGLSLTPGPDSMGMENNSSSQAVVGLDLASTTGHRGGMTTGYFNQHHSSDRLQPNRRPSAIGIARSRSPQSTLQLQTQFTPEFPVPRQPSPPYDPGAVAYLHFADQGNRNPSSPVHSPDHGEGQRLTSAFSVSELSPQYSPHAPPPSMDETWGSTPDPIKTSASYQPSVDRWQSFTTVGGRVHDPGDTVVISPMDPPTQDPTQFQSPTSPESDVSSPYTIRPGNFGSRPSPITEVAEMLGHSQDGSNDSGTWMSTRSDTSGSLPVVMTAERVQLNPSAVSLTSPTYTTSPAVYTSSNYGESLPSTGGASQFPQLPPPPLPPLPQVKPLSLGKKRSVQGPP